MSQRREFSQQWKTRFPHDKLPDLTSLDAGRRSPLQDQYDQTKRRAEELKKELEKQEFVASFLWDLLHGVNAVQDNAHNKKSLNLATNDLDNDVPAGEISPDNEQFGGQYENIGLKTSSLNKKKEVIIFPKTSTSQDNVPLKRASSEAARSPVAAIHMPDGDRGESTTDSLKRIAIKQGGSLNRHRRTEAGQPLTDTEKISAKYNIDVSDTTLEAPVLSTFSGGSMKKKAPIPAPRPNPKPALGDEVRRSGRLSQFQADKETVPNKATYVNPPVVPQLQSPEPTAEPPKVIHMMKPITKKKKVPTATLR